MDHRWAAGGGHLRPLGVNRRHFLQHLAGASAMAGSAAAFTESLRASAGELKRNGMSAIMLWMGGGPSTIDIWDMKPGTPTGGPFRPISTSADVKICEHLPRLARQMHHLSIIRSMSTREADHARGRYYMHTGYVPNPSVRHPSYGAVVAKELASQTPALDLPPFIAIGGGTIGPGFLGMRYAPLVVDARGNIRHLQSDVDASRLAERMRFLSIIQHRFEGQNRGRAAGDHSEVLNRTLALMTSRQRGAFRVEREPESVRARYGRSNFGRGCLMARRLVEQGVPFVEVDLGGWDTHAGNFTRLEQKLPEMDQAMAALIDDLDQRGLLPQTVIVWLGEFGRTPRINGNAGRDHWARSWSCVVGGGKFSGGGVVGHTSGDGKHVESEPHASEDLMASVCHAMGISLQKSYTSRSGRPMKIAGGGRVIAELFG